MKLMKFFLVYMIEWYDAALQIYTVNVF